MAFWGVEVKPGKPYTHVYDGDKGKLRLTQATLGNGTSPKRVIVQCNVGNKSPVLICALLPDKAESFSLDLEFEEKEDVILSVVGPRSVHLCGYFLGSTCDGDETDSYGEDIVDSEGDYSRSSDDDAYEEDFIDDSDLEMFPPSPKAKSGVLIEEITEEEPEKSTNGHCRLRKQRIIESEDDIDPSELQIVPKHDRTEASDSEDDDGFPISISLKNSDLKSAEGTKFEELDNGKQGKDGSGSQRGAVQSSKVPDKKSKKKKKEQLHKEKCSDINVNMSEDKTRDETILNETTDADHIKDGELIENENSENVPKKKKKIAKKAGNVDSLTALPVEGTTSNVDSAQNLQENGEEGKTSANSKDSTLNSILVPEDAGKSNKKNKKKRAKSDVSRETGVNDSQNKSNSKTEKRQKKGKSDVMKTDEQNELVKDTTVEENEVKSKQTRSFSNGLTIDELAMGKPDGQRASSGKKVLVNYIGKLQNGKIFDSNVGKRPFQFRLGVGQVIKGWDVGVNGMRIGDKRRLTVPPSMGYGSKNVGQIPANSTLVFDVELVGVK